jgi:hypothetical protein
MEACDGADARQKGGAGKAPMVSLEEIQPTEDKKGHSKSTLAKDEARVGSETTASLESTSAPLEGWGSAPATAHENGLNSIPGDDYQEEGKGQLSCEPSAECEALDGDLDEEFEDEDELPEEEFDPYVLVMNNPYVSPSCGRANRAYTLSRNETCLACRVEGCLVPVNKLLRSLFAGCLERFICARKGRKSANSSSSDIHTLL